MTPLQISKKGRALLANRELCTAVVKAIATDDEGKLYSKEGLKVIIGNKSITVRNATKIKK